MKKMLILTAATALVSLAACNKSPQEQAADNIEANADAMADNLEDAADNATSPMMENKLDNEAAEVRATGDNEAKDMRTHDADTNLANGM